MKHGLKGARKNNTSSRLFNADDRNPGISYPEPAEFSKVDDINSGDSEDEQFKTTEKSVTGMEESDRDQKSDSEEKLERDTENVPSDMEESEEEKPDLVGTHIGNEEANLHLEEEQSDESREEEADKADRTEQSDSQGAEADDSDSNVEAEISEDEPLVQHVEESCGQSRQTKIGTIQLMQEFRKLQHNGSFG
ncbi:hypothetical protein RHMOL_Rhmol13G0184300 [Rhododendron molle]|nr:hypothetical protein RHMOL_Rhmol13G0184300 [Rhododendron molle]